MKRIVVLLLCLCMLLPMLFAMTAVNAGAEANTPNLATDKAVYAPGEAIKITADEGNAQDWVGIVPADANGDPITKYGALYWKYVNDLDGTGIRTNAGGQMKDDLAALLWKEMGLSSKEELLSIPTGKYYAVCCNITYKFGWCSFKNMANRFGYCFYNRSCCFFYFIRIYCYHLGKTLFQASALDIHFVFCFKRPRSTHFFLYCFLYRLIYALEEFFLVKLFPI